MSMTTKSTAEHARVDSVKVAVEENPGATTEGIGLIAGVARSTAAKTLAMLSVAGEVTRHRGGRDRGKRLPDRWTLAGEEMPPAYAGHATSSASTEPADAKPPETTEASAAASASVDRRLKAGGLEPLVLDYLEQHADSGPHGPTAIAKALERSSGAVGNCLERLTGAKKVRQVSDKPRRYSKAA